MLRVLIKPFLTSLNGGLTQWQKNIKNSNTSIAIYEIWTSQASELKNYRSLNV